MATPSAALASSRSRSKGSPSRSRTIRAYIDDEAPVGVVGEAAVARADGDRLDGLVVQPQVEDRVHHPGHRERRPGPHADEQRVLAGPQAPAHALLHPGQRVGHLLVEPVGPALGQVGPAGLGGDREPRRHGELEHRGHLGEVGPLAPEEALQLPRRLRVGVIEGVDERHGAHSTEEAATTPRRPGPGRATTASSTGGTIGGRCWRGLGGREQPSLRATLRLLTERRQQPACGAVGERPARRRRSGRASVTQVLEQIVDRHPLLRHRVPLADGDGAVLEASRSRR